MIVNKTVVQHKIGDRLYELIVCPSSPLEEIQQALTFYKGLIQEKLEEASKQNEKINDAQKEEISESDSIPS